MSDALVAQLRSMHDKRPIKSLPTPEGDAADEIERLRAVLEEIQFQDCCYDTRVLVDAALEADDE